MYTRIEDLLYTFIEYLLRLSTPIIPSSAFHMLSMYVGRSGAEPSHPIFTPTRTDSHPPSQPVPPFLNLRQLAPPFQAFKFRYLFIQISILLPLNRLQPILDLYVQSKSRLTAATYRLAMHSTSTCTADRDRTSILYYCHCRDITVTNTLFVGLSVGLVDPDKFEF